MLKVGRYIWKKSLLCPTNECWPQWHFSKNAFLDLFQWDILLTPFLILWGNQINCFSFWRYKNTQMATLPDNASWTLRTQNQEREKICRWPTFSWVVGVVQPVCSQHCKAPLTFNHLKSQTRHCRNYPTKITTNWNLPVFSENKSFTTKGKTHLTTFFDTFVISTTPSPPILKKNTPKEFDSQPWANLLISMFN